MNIFIEAQKFYVGTPLYSVIDADKDLLSLASDIRKQHGEWSFKSDEYLTTILRAANLYSVQGACENAAKDFRDIRRVCMDIIEDKNELHNHEYYPVMKAFIEENRSRFKDRYTLISMACAVAAPVFMEGMAKKYFDSLAEKLRGLTDVVELRHLYRDMTYTAGEQDAERLNNLIKGRFFIAMTGDVYLQALTEQYLMELLHRDQETGRYVIQIILDDLKAAPE